ncbi:MAG: type II toxin-antitoxin system RelE/ParE family toxin [Magnetospirillum sp. WYHS-4]
MAGVIVRWTRRALLNLDAQADHIAKDDPGAARNMAARVFACVDRLGEFPGLGRPGRVAGARELVVDGTPYVVVYREAPMGVQVLHVLHGARRWPASP